MNIISECFHTIEKHNPISGHRWTEQGESYGWEVSGGYWTRTFHKKYEAAVKEKEIRDSIDKKFPFFC